MLTTLVFASAYAATPAEAERWITELDYAVEHGQQSWLKSAFAELFTRVDGLSVDSLRTLLRREMEGNPEVECRGQLCRVQWVRPDERSSFVLHQVDGDWRLWDEAFGSHIHGPVSASLKVQGPGEVEVRVNGTPTFLFDPVRDADTAVIDRHLSAGINLVTLVPRGNVSVSLEVQGPNGNLVVFEGELGATRAFPFVVKPGPVPLPR
ncbi:MAG: hypothetical protein AAGA48_30055 [Myxococcota bacterium]